MYGNCIYGCDRCGEVVLCLDTAFIDGGADGPSCMEKASLEHRAEAERRLRPGMLKSWANLPELEAQVANELATEGCFLVGLVQMNYVIPSPYGAISRMDGTSWIVLNNGIFSSVIYENTRHPTLSETVFTSHHRASS